MKVAAIVGARPQFIKAQPVSIALRKRHEEVLVHTGQHYSEEMSELIFRELSLPEPDYNLGVGSGSHGWQTGRMLIGIEEILLKERPDLVMIYGDTNSTVAGALAASKLRLPMAHVESGLRSFNRAMPEEINRLVSDVVSDIRFCPTKRAVSNLRKEGVTSGVHLVGDTMYDAMLLHRAAAQKSKILDELCLEDGGYLLLTLHRPSNTDDGKNLAAIMDAIGRTGEAVVFPVHPRTEKALKESGLWKRYAGSSIKLIKPVGYLEFTRLLMGCDKVLTDSGGIQKEAYFLKRPCITLREETEWIETVEDGWNTIVGADREKIKDAIANFAPKGRQRKHYGDGHASERIVEVLEGS